MLSSRRTHRFEFGGYDRLVADVQTVLETLESQDVACKRPAVWCFKCASNRIGTIENVIEGVVITFVDVTEMQRAEEKLQAANQCLRLAAVVRDSSDAISVHDLDGRIIAWNPSAASIYGWSEEEALRMNIRQRVPSTHQRECMAKIAELSQQRS